MEKVSEQLRRFMEESGKTRADIARACGVSQAQLSRFANEKSALSTTNVDRIAEYLRLELRRKRSPRK